MSNDDYSEYEIEIDSNEMDGFELANSSDDSNSGSDYSYYDDNDWTYSFPYEENIFYLNRRYTFLERLTTGDDVIVYKAIDRKYKDKKVIVKIFSDLEKGVKPKNVQILQMLNKEKIKNVSELLAWYPFPETECYAVVLTYIENIGNEYILIGDSLKNHMFKLLEIVADLHVNMILYRDIKKSNVLIEKETDRVVLIDFDCSTFYNPKRKHRGEVGTQNHYAKEMTLSRNKNHPGYTLKVDMFAVGMHFAELLLGLDECTEYVDKVREMLRNDKNISDTARDLVFKLLNDDPLERFSALEALKHPYFN